VRLAKVLGTLWLLAAVCAALRPAHAVTPEDIAPSRSSLDPVDPDSASGGRINGLAVVAGDNRTFYAASEWGGIFKSRDGGNTWFHLDGHLPTATWDVEVDPSNPLRVYATSFYDGRVASHAGVNVSLDGGATWVHPPSAQPPAGFCLNPAARDEPSAFGIAIDANAPSNVFVATNCGLAVSRDSGVTWTFLDPTPASPASTVWDVIVHHRGIVDVCGLDGHLRSTDGGLTWTTATGTLPLPSGRCSLAASPDEPWVVFAVAGRTIFETDDGGANWNRAYPYSRPQGRIPFMATNDRSGPGYDLWFGDIELYRRSCTTPPNPAPGGGRRCGPGTPWSEPFTRSAGAHDDAGDLAFDSQAQTDACPRLFACDGGIFVNTLSTSPACHSPAWEQPAVTPHALWSWTLAGVRQPGAEAEDLYLGAQDNGNFGSRTAGGMGRVDWTSRDCCDGFDMAAEANRVLSTICCFGGPHETHLYITGPGLAGGTEIINYPPGNLLGFQQLGSIANFAPNSYVVATSTGVYVTTNIAARTVVWTQLGAASTPPNRCGVQAALQGTVPTFFLKSGGCNGDQGGTLWRYTGTGTGGTWQQVVRPGAGQLGVYAVDRNDPNRIFASDLGGTAGPQMVLTRDGGATWQTLPALDALMTGGGAFRYRNTLGPTGFTNFNGYPQPTLVAIDPDPSLHGNVLVAAGADSGVFVSVDGGASWTRLTDPPGFQTACSLHVPRARYAHFDHDTADRIRVYLGTQGRGMWRLTIPASLRGLDTNEDGDGFGQALAAGDFNGDHILDLAVGAPTEAPGTGPRSGSVFVFRGTPNGLQLWQRLDQRPLDPNELNDRFGASLAAGDFNGDGLADLAVGTPLEDPGPGLDDAGRVYTFRGSAAGLTPWQSLGQAPLDTDEKGDRFGSSLAAGDFDGDGRMDLAVGAPTESPGTGPQSGWVYTFRGSPQGLAPAQGFGQAGLDTDEALDDFGRSLAAGDFDGDGKADLAVGAPAEAVGAGPRAGLVYTFRGGTPTLLSPWQKLGQTAMETPETGDQLGRSLAAGDFDGDNRADLAVGAPKEAPGTDPKSGYVFTYRGSAAGLLPWQGLSQAGLEANEADDQFGQSLAVGDFSGDGRSDLAVGAPGETLGTAAKTGAVFAFKGSAGGLVGWKVIDQTGLDTNEGNDLFGSALAAGDFTGDGIADLAAGAPSETVGTPRSGALYTFKGTGDTLAACRGHAQDE